MKTKIKEFQKHIDSEITRISAKIEPDILEDAEIFKKIDLQVFNCENQYNGDLKNKIFFTYNDHYKGNSGLNMTISYLGNPHINIDDRGYVKGVATDLDGYLTLKSLLASEVFYYDNIYIHKPKFRKSKNSEFYKNTIDIMEAEFKSKIESLKNQRKNAIENMVKFHTSMSLAYYIKPI